MRILIVTAALAAFAAPAIADSQWTATLVQPQSKVNVVAGSVVWDCEGSACQATSDTSEADQLTACRSIVREVGTVSAFATSSGPFSASRLSSCNAVAAKPKP